MMKNIIIFSSGVLSLFLASLNYAAAPQVPEETATQIFKSAKFQKTNLGWESRCSLGNISYYGDLNKDGSPDAVVVDGGVGCYANTGIGFYSPGFSSPESIRLSCPDSEPAVAQGHSHRRCG